MLRCTLFPLCQYGTDTRYLDWGEGGIIFVTSSHQGGIVHQPDCYIPHSFHQNLLLSLPEEPEYMKELRTVS